MTRRVHETVIIEVDGSDVTCEKGCSLFNALINGGRLVGSACGGRGVCHLCRVTVLEGTVAEPGAVEKRALGNVLVAKGMRLACRVTVDGPMRIALPVSEGSK